MNIPYNGEKIVLFAGKLTTFKGVENLLSAARYYEEQESPRILTLIAGDGQEREELMDLSQMLGLKSTYFLGHKTAAQTLLCRRCVCHSFPQGAFWPCRPGSHGLRYTGGSDERGRLAGIC